EGALREGVVHLARDSSRELLLRQVVEIVLRLAGMTDAGRALHRARRAVAAEVRRFSMGRLRIDGLAGVEGSFRGGNDEARVLAVGDYDAEFLAVHGHPLGNSGPGAVPTAGPPLS